MKKLLLTLLAVAAVSAPGRAVQQFQSDNTHEIGLDQTSSIFFRDPYTTNVQLSTMAAPGKWMYQGIQNAVALSSTSMITPTAKYINVGSTGTNINMAGSGSSNLPVISTAGVMGGTEIVLISTQATATVTVASGTASGLDLGAATRVLANGKALSLYFNSIMSQWVEKSYGSN